MPKNYVEYNDANTVLGAYANAIKAATPIEITYAQFQQLTPQQQETGNYIVTDYPGSNLEVVDSVTNGDQRAVTSNAVYDEMVARVKRRTVTDLNNANTANSLEILTFGAGTTNSPNSTVSGIAISFGSQNASTETGYVTQLAMSNLDLKLYMRKLSSSTWSNWVSITLS